MTVNPRNLLLFVALSGAALVTWVLARVSVGPAAPTAAQGPASQGYYLLDAELLGTNDDGRVSYRVLADRVEQGTQGEDFVLERMSVEYTPEADIRWNIFAERGVTDESRNSWRLERGVRLAYVPDDDQEETVFETNELYLDADGFRAFTNRAVEMRKGESQISASGLELDLQTDDWTLGASDDSNDANVTIRTSR